MNITKKHEEKYWHIRKLNILPLVLTLIFGALSCFNFSIILSEWSRLDLGDLSEKYLTSFSQLIICYPIVFEYFFISLFFISLVALIKGGFKNLKDIEEGLISGLIIGLIIGFIGGLISGLISGLIYGWISGLIYGWISGLIIGWISGLISGLIYGWISGLIIGWISGLIIGWISGLIIGWISGLIIGLIIGLIYGLIEEFDLK